MSLVIGLLTLSNDICSADGVFVFRWDKKVDINEPTQKAILLHDQGREDLILQVKYEGPAEEFGWLVPVPGLPEVRKGSMDCFYELSQLTQKHFPSASNFTLGMAVTKGLGDDNEVKVIKIETVGAYEVAVLAAGNATKLSQWLDANGFVFPKDKRPALNDYVKKNWYFVAIRINPNQTGFTRLDDWLKMSGLKKTISEPTRKQLANGELHPLVISFASKKCVFPLAISSINGKPSEVSLYVLSAEPLMSKTIFDKKFDAYAKAREDWLRGDAERRRQRDEARKKLEESRDKRLAEVQKRMGTNANFARRGVYANDDPADPRPPMSKMRELTGAASHPPPIEPGDDFLWEEPLFTSMEAGPKDLADCAKELPRLAGKSWWLTKQVQTFAPDEMRDLEFEPAIPVLADTARKPDGAAQCFLCLAQFGARAVPAIIAGMNDANPEMRKKACEAASNMEDPRLGTAAASLLADEKPQTREFACYTMGQNWTDADAPQLVKMLSDPSDEVRRAAGFILQRHPNPSLAPTYRKIIADDTVAAGQAINLVNTQEYSRAELVRLFTSTNLPVLSTAFTRLRYSLTVDELAPLLTNSMTMARLMALGELTGICSKEATDRIVTLLRDPNEIVRYRARAALRSLTGQKLGADPAAYEKWWKENRETCVLTLPPAWQDRTRRPLPFQPAQ